MKYSSWILVIALVACGGSNRDEMSVGDAGDAPSSSNAARKIANTSDPASPKDEPETIAEADAGTRVDASMDPSDTPTADAGTTEPPSNDAGAAMGQAGQSAGSAGQGGSSASGTGGAGGDAAGSSAAGMGGAGGVGGAAAGTGGTPSESSCPLGDADADGNGYPDACEQALWTGGVSAANKCVLGETSIMMPAWLLPECGSSSFGKGVYAMPTASTGIDPTVTGEQIVDVENDADASAVASCLTADDTAALHMLAIFGTTGHAPNPESIADYVQANATPHLAGKHILYFKIEFDTYVTKSVGVSSAVCNNQNGTNVQSLSAKVTAYGY